MPCLVLCGHPCAGKTRLAELIRDRALIKYSDCIRKVIIVNEASASPDQTMAQCYATSQAEKFTRGALKSAFDRLVSSGDEASSTLIILDSLNYIKGFRYELFCISKAAGQKHAVIWVLNESRLCKEWNATRRQMGAGETVYSDTLMEELIRRFEPPDARNRWDNPLYRIDVRPPGVKQQSGLAKEALEQSVYNMHKLSDAMDDGATVSAPSNKTSTTFQRAGFKKKIVRPSRDSANNHDNHDNKQGGESSVSVSGQTNNEESMIEVSNGGNTTTLDIVMRDHTIEEQIDEMLQSFLLSVEPLKEGMSTQQNVSSDANVLHDVDSITQQVCSLITAAQNKATTAGGRLSITVGDHDKEPICFDFNRRIPLAELRRLRRQYIQWVAARPPQDTSERGIAQAFVTYIAAQ